MYSRCEAGQVVPVAIAGKHDRVPVGAGSLASESIDVDAAQVEHVSSEIGDVNAGRVEDEEALVAIAKCMSLETAEKRDQPIACKRSLEDASPCRPAGDLQSASSADGGRGMAGCPLRRHSAIAGPVDETH